MKYRLRRLYVLAATLPLLVILFIGVYFSLHLAPKSKAVWYSDDWAYRKLVPVTAHTGAETNKYFSVTVDSSDTTKFQGDCGDIRFTDANGKLLQYYIASGCSSASTVIHVLVPTFPIDASDYYMYYGNPNAPNGFSAADFTAGTGVTVGSVGSETKGTGPIAYWKFDEGTDNTCSGGTNDACDSTSNHNDGASSNGPAWQSEDKCISGKCLFFDGVNDVVNAGSGNSLDNITSMSVSGWFKMNSWGANDKGRIMDKGTGSPVVGWGIYACGPTCDKGNTDSLGLYVGFNNDTTSGWWSTPTNSLTLNTWYHFVIVYNRSSSANVPTMYLNGLQQTVTTGGAPSGTADNDSAIALTIGDRIDADRTWKGYIDELKIYNYALSSAQVLANYRSRAGNEGASVSVGAVNQRRLSDGLIGYWKMDETTWAPKDCSTGVVLDSSGNGSNGKTCPITTGPSGGDSGEFGLGGLLDGTNDYIDVGDNSLYEFGSSTAQLTFAAWIKPTTVPPAANYAILSKYNSSGSQKEYFLYVGTTGKLQLSISGDGSAISTTSSTSTLTQGVWQHVAGTYDLVTNKVRLYINGKLDKENTLALSSIFTGTASFQIGAVARSTTSPDFFFGGTMDEVRVYNKVLTPQDITQLYNFAPGPVGYWKLDEKTGTSAFDASGNGNTGTLTSGPTWTNGKFGSAVNFDGLNDSVDIPRSGSLTKLGSTFTISLWFKLNSTFNSSSTTSIPLMTSNTVTTGDNISMILRGSDYTSGSGTTGTLQLKMKGNNNAGVHYWHTNTAAWTANQWYYITGVFNGSAALSTVYVNGIPDKSGTFTDSNGTIFDDGNFGSATYRFGGGDPDVINLPGAIYLPGQVDEFKIYNYSRTGQQIIEDMNAGHPTGGSPVGSETVLWHLDEQNGNTVNNSGSGGSSLNGTNSGATWLTNTTCKTSGCLNFDTSTDSVSAGDTGFTDSLTGFSVSFWINPQTLAIDQSIISKNAASQKSFAVVTDHTTSSELRIHIAASTAEADNTTYCTTAAGTLVASTWTHFAIVYDGTQNTAANRVTVYKNGKPVTCTMTGTFPTSMTSGSTSNLKLGDDDSATYTALLTYLDEVKLYGGVLTQDQVNLDYNGGGSQNFGVTGSTEASLLTDTAGNAPINYWNMNEKTGTTTNDLGSGQKNGTISGNTTWTQGKYGAGLVFDGASGVDAIGGFTPPSVMTYEGWLYIRSAGENSLGRIINHSNFDFFTQTSTILFQATWTTPGKWTAPLPSLNTWHHVVAVYDFGSTSNTPTIYVDGIAQTVTLSQSPSGSLALSSATLRLGNTSADDRTFDGKMDDVLIYNYARTAAQIAYDYNRGRPLAWWKFDECSGTTAYDSAGSNNATITIGTGAGTGHVDAVGTCTTSGTSWFNGATGKFNSSIGLDGIDDFVSASSNFGFADQVTISAWYNTNTLSLPATPPHRMIFTSSDAASYISLNIDGAANPFISLRISGTQRTLSSLTASTVGVWTHVVGTYDGTNIRLYVNGRLRATSGSFPGTLSGFTSGTAYIGKYSSVGYEFSGQIDDVRVYPYALSANQIKQLYAGGGGTYFGPASGSP